MLMNLLLDFISDIKSARLIYQLSATRHLLLQVNANMTELI